MVRGGSAYIITNKNHTVLYTGVTAELYYRILEHREKQHPNSFSARYNLFKLVRHEDFTRIEEAIAREKQIKAGSRKGKITLIESLNPEWRDLFDDL